MAISYVFFLISYVKKNKQKTSEKRGLFGCTAEKFLMKKNQKGKKSNPMKKQKNKKKEKKRTHQGGRDGRFWL